MFSSLLEDMIKDRDEQPDEEVHGERSRRIPSAGASVPMELGCATSKHVGVLIKPHSVGFFVEASSCRLDLLLIQSPAPRPSPLSRG